MNRLPMLSLLLSTVALGIGCGGAPGSPGPTPPEAGPSPVACTEIGCAHGLEVDFEPSSDWPPGAYRIEIAGDGKSTVCEITLPFRTCEADGSSKCTGELGAMVGESGCALPPEQHGISGIALHDQYPSQITIEVTRDGESLSSTSLTPTYLTVQPNGPHCEPICRSASAQIAIAAGGSFQP